MNLKTKLSLVLIFVLSITTLDIVVKADPLEEQLQQHNQSIEENTSKLSTYEAQENELKLAIQELDNKIESAMHEQTKLEEEINILNNMIKESNQKIEEYTKEIDSRENQKNLFVRNMYKFGELSYVDVVFKSDNVFDATYNFYNYSVLVNSLQENIEELNKLKKYLIDEQTRLELNKEELEKANTEIKTVVDEMNLMINEQKNKLTELNAVQANLIYKIESEKAAAANITAMLEKQKLEAELERQKQEEAKKQAESQNQDQINKNEESSTSSDGFEEDSSSSYTNSNSITAVEVVAYASEFQGVPYVWGGTSPSGFDCSGLVQYCYSKFGYSLPRVSQDQQNVGTNVSISELKTGDLVFWGNPATHVAFYIDGGYILHAPNTGDVVRIQSVNLNSITSAKRIIN